MLLLWEPRDPDSEYRPAGPARRALPERLRHHAGGLHVEQLPQAERPRLFVFGESLGSKATESAFADLDEMVARASAIDQEEADKMAAEGCRFTDFYSAYCVCSSSRASLLTGLYPHQADIGHMLGDLGVRDHRGSDEGNATIVAGGDLGEDEAMRIATEEVARVRRRRRSSGS